MANLSSSVSAQPSTNESVGWHPFNLQRLRTLIQNFGNQSPGYHPEGRPYAVFDWDNTSVFLDTEESTLMFQLQELRFAATPDQLKQAITQGVPPDPQVLALTEDVLDCYRWLYQHSDRLAGEQSLDVIQATPQWKSFVVKFRSLYDQLEERFGPVVAYPWLTFRFVGMRREEVQQLGRDAVLWQLEQPVQTQTCSSSDQNPGKSGVTTVHWKSGLRLIPEMQQLIADLRSNGIDVWICTASFTDVIEGVSSQFGYRFSPEHVIGMNLKRETDGKITTQLIPGYPMTYGPGKTEAIQRLLVTRYGSGPILVAGDSDGDQAMLQDFPETQISLIIDLHKPSSSKIGQLATKARAQRGDTAARFLLQGRSERSGRFVRDE